MSALPNHIRDLENAAPVRQGNYPCLILNADFQPLSYFPLSLWSWQDAVKAVFLDRVNVVEQYEQFVRSTNFEMQIPSVVALKDYVPQNRSPAFTRFNLFLRDGFECAYCRSPHELTFDHVIPRRLGEFRPCSRPCINYRHKVDASRQITCMRVGSIFSIGMLSLKSKP